MKKLKVVLACVFAFCLVVPFAIFATGCSYLGLSNSSNSNSNSIERIAKTSSNGLVDTYTIYYSDGSTSQFTVTNGEKGEKGDTGSAGQKGEDGVVDVEALYEKYKEETGSNISFEEFVNAFLDFEIAEDNSKTINECLLSAVKICCEFDATVQTTYFSPRTGTTTTNSTSRVASRGSGVIYQMDNDYTYILTNYHVMNYYPSSSSGQTFIGAELKVCVGWLYGCGGSFTGNYDTSGNLTNLTYDGYEIEMEYVGGSQKADIAVLRVPTSDILAKNTQAKAVETAAEYYVGETAIAVGNPEDMGISVTEGIISVDNEFVALSIGGETDYYRSIRIDTSIYSGSSGGALFNKNGKLIGITNSGMSSDENVNWAIPIGIVKGAADNIISQVKGGATDIVKVKKVLLGITVESQNSAYHYNATTGYGNIEEEVSIKTIVEGSIAEGLGLAVGDVIKTIQIADTTWQISRYFEIGDALYTARLGDTITITYERAGVENTASFTVTELSEQK